MVRDLLKINRASFHEALVGLSQNWVERFFHIKVENRHGVRKRHDQLKLFNRVRRESCSFLQVNRRHRHRVCHALQVRPSVKDINRHRSGHDRLILTEERGANTLEEVLYNTFLRSDLLFISHVHVPLFRPLPVLLGEEVVTVWAFERLEFVGRIF